MLTGHSDEEDKVHALNLCADDYNTKPFSHRELVARLHVRLRRHERQGDGDLSDGLNEPAEMAGRQPATVRGAASDAGRVLRAGPLTLDTRPPTLYGEGRPIRLSSIQFRLLRLSMECAGIVIPAEEILRRVLRTC